MPTKSTILIALCVALFIIVGAVFVSSQPSSLHKVRPTLTPSSLPTSPFPQPLTYPDTKDWSLYQNYKLGIAFRFPQYTSVGKTLFVRAGDILFITNSSSPVFIHRNELARLKSDTDIIQATKRVNSLHEEPPAMIFTRIIRSNGDLDRLIKFRYGQGCRLGSLRESYGGQDRLYQNAVYDVDIAPVTPGIDGLYDSSCFVNWVMYFKYAPEYKLAAVWDIGQESYLYTDTCSGIPQCSIDQGIADSFFFIEPNADAHTYIDSVMQDN